jgi:hypothetical protein
MARCWVGVSLIQFLLSLYPAQNPPESQFPRPARTMQISESYATKVRKGLRVPHPTHWQKLAELVRV